MTEIDKIRDCTMKIYENSTEIKVLQEKLEDMLSAIDKINLDFNRGKIPKGIFEADNEKLRQQSVELIKNINRFVNDNLNYTKKITNETVKLEQIEEVKEVKEKKDRGKKVTKKAKRKIKTGNLTDVQKLEVDSSIYQVASSDKT